MITFPGRHLVRPLVDIPAGSSLIARPSLSRERSSQSLAFGRTKINSSDPTLTAVFAPHATPPFLPVFYPPIELASFRPGGRLHLDRRIDFSAICFGTLLHLVVAEMHI
jgi:hypothetical protein